MSSKYSEKEKSVEQSSGGRSQFQIVGKRTVRTLHRISICPKDESFISGPFESTSEAPEQSKKNSSGNR